jgi:ribosomal protein L11 methyltransferase
VTLGVVVSPPAELLELAADALWSLGAVAVEERDGELWTSLGDDRAWVAAAMPTTWPYRFVELDDTAADTWREFAKPTHISPTLVITPKWVTYECSVGERVISIDPGATFGMGDHPTTVLSLQALEALVGDGDVVLDVGCGSGVLAIASLLVGAERAVGIDINPASVEVSRANAQSNGVNDRLSVSNAPLSEVAAEYPREFDVVFANILAPALIELAPDLKHCLKPSGHLVISGILATNYDHVLAALLPLQVVAVATKDVWAAITLQWPLNNRHQSASSTAAPEDVTFRP